MCYFKHSNSLTLRIAWNKTCRSFIIRSFSSGLSGFNSVCIVKGWPNTSSSVDRACSGFFEKNSNVVTAFFIYGTYT